MKTTRETIAAAYVDRIGYDPFEDEPTNTPAEVIQTLAEHAEEAGEVNPFPELSAALETLSPLTFDAPVTRETLPYIRQDIADARREFTHEEYTPEEHSARLAALETLDTLLPH